MANYLLSPKAVRKLSSLFRGKFDSSLPSPVDAVIDDDDYPQPFSVRWSQSENSGGGSWVIWIPSSRLVSVNNTTADPTASLSEAETLPSGWWLVDNLPASTGGTLYLNATKSSSGSGGYSVAFSTTATTADDSFAVPVCTASVIAATGERRVKQLLASAVTLSTGGGGGGGDATIDEDVAAMKVASLQRKTHSGSGTEYIEVANFHNADSGTVPIAVYAKNERNESIKTISWEKLYVEWNVDSISSPDGSFITDIKYDADTHQIKVKRRSFKTETVQIMSDPPKTIEILTQVGTESGFEMITGGQCVEQVHIEPET